jgi:hypothetical protein
MTAWFRSLTCLSLLWNRFLRATCIFSCEEAIKLIKEHRRFNSFWHSQNFCDAEISIYTLCLWQVDSPSSKPVVSTLALPYSGGKHSFLSLYWRQANLPRSILMASLLALASWLVLPYTGGQHIFLALYWWKAHFLALYLWQPDLPFSILVISWLALLYTGDKLTCLDLYCWLADLPRSILVASWLAFLYTSGKLTCLTLYWW